MKANRPPERKQDKRLIMVVLSVPFVALGGILALTGHGFEHLWNILPLHHIPSQDLHSLGKHILDSSKGIAQNSKNIVESSMIAPPDPVTMSDLYSRFHFNLPQTPKDLKSLKALGGSKEPEDKQL